MRFKTFFLLGTALSASANAGASIEVLKKDMSQYLDSLRTVKGWQTYLKDHSGLCTEVSEKTPSSVNVQEVKIDGQNLALGCRSVYIEAKPKSIVEVIDKPKFFQALYGLNKSAEMGEVKKDGSFDARVFKLVPGIVTQDYVLHYTPHWETDKVWIERATQLSDAKNFAIRDNAKIVEPLGHGTIHREVTLFYPQMWWMKLLNGVVRKITAKELTKLNVALKCAAEKVESGVSMSEEIARTCHEKAEQ